MQKGFDIIFDVHEHSRKEITQSGRYIISHKNETQTLLYASTTTEEQTVLSPTTFGENSQLTIYILLYARCKLIIDVGERISLKIPHPKSFVRKESVGNASVSGAKKFFITAFENVQGAWKTASSRVTKLIHGQEKELLPFPNWSGKFIDNIGLTRYNIFSPNNVELISREIDKSTFDRPKIYFRSADYSDLIDNGDVSNLPIDETQIHQVIWHTLETTLFRNSSEKSSDSIGINSLLQKRVFTTAFPLHSEIGKEQNSPTIRDILHQTWANFSSWYKYQPIETIRDYFGEQIAIYFAWLGFYTAWLVPAALFGCFIFLLGCKSAFHQPAVQQICNSENITMCAKCETCKPEPLTDSCNSSRWAFMFDHTGSVVFSVFMSLWAVAFLEYWKRENASLAHRWGVEDFKMQDAKPRPAYQAKAKKEKSNPITDQNEPYISPWLTKRRMCISFLTLFVMIFIALIAVASCIVYRTIMHDFINRKIAEYDLAHEHGMLHENLLSETIAHFLGQHSRMVASGSAAILNLIFILSLGFVYQKVAVILTEWEMHRTQLAFDSALTLKVFIFQFVNFYSSVFYVAFFKGKFLGWPGEWKTTFGRRNESCPAGGCLIELAIQLGVIMVGKQFLNNCCEFMIQSSQLTSKCQ